MTTPTAPPALSLAVLHEAVDHAGSPWRSVTVVERTGSTNADLVAAATSGSDIDGAVLFAELQTAGRGRHGRTWLGSPRSQVLMSVGVGVAGVAPARWGWLPLAGGLAVVDALAPGTALPVTLKWPNDVLVGGAKLAGLLAEVTADRRHVVLGIGLNVSAAATQGVAGSTSLAEVGAGGRDRSHVARALLATLAARIAQWRRGARAQVPGCGLIDDYTAASHTIGAGVEVTLPGGRRLTGVARGVDEFGRLCVAQGDDVVAVSAGDVTRLRAPG